MNPSVGRIVHFIPRDYTAGPSPVAGEPLAAIITRVHNESLVNLTVFNPDGSIEGLTSVPFGDDNRENTWIWPPRV